MTETVDVATAYEPWTISLGLVVVGVLVGVLVGLLAKAMGNQRASSS
ncbi:hypothetical protein [Nocardia fluminea]